MTWNTPKPGEWKSEELSQGRIIDYKAFNFVDGEGVRNSLYVAGCMFHCEGCYNVATWSFNAGIPYTPELEEQIFIFSSILRYSFCNCFFILSSLARSFLSRHSIYPR